VAALRQRRHRRHRRGYDRRLERRRAHPILIRVLLLAAALGAATLARGQESGPYVGAALGQASLTAWCDTGGSPIQLTQCDDETSAWKLFGGYRFSSYLAAEAWYVDWGKVTASTSAGGVSAEQQGFGIAGVASLPIGQGFSLHAKLGLLSTEQQTQSATSRVDRSDTEALYGIGARYAFAGALAVRAEWERADKLEARLISLGVEYRF
jgi:OOP family OmpA-OmpF porin